MRTSGGLFCLILLALPGASAASQLHVGFLDDAYALTFTSDAPEPIAVRSGAESAPAMRVDFDGLGDATDRVFRAQLPARALRYEIEGRAFDLAAPPARGNATRIAYVADIGLTQDARAILAAIATQEPDLLLVGGDLSYANGNASAWNAWFDMIEPIAARIPVMPAFGNHEGYCESANGSLDACGSAANEWRAHFPVPLHYAFAWGPARIVVLDTEAYVHGEKTQETNASAQEAMLREELARDDGRWEIAMFHRPLRTTHARDGASSDEARAALEPILDAGRADLALQGHLHAYERTHPMQAGARAANGTTYVTSGGGGQSLYTSWGPEAAWTARRATAFHFVLLDVSPTRIDVTTLDANATVLDAFTLTRPEPVKATPALTLLPTRATPAPSASPSAPTRSAIPTTPSPEETRAMPIPLASALVAALLAAITTSGRRPSRPSRARDRSSARAGPSRAPRR